MKYLFIAISMALSSAVIAQDQMAMRINEQGILKILRMAIQYNTASKADRTVTIPKDIYKFTIPKSQIRSVPLIPIINEISDLNLNRDLDFYLNTSDIKISGQVDAKSIKTTIFNSSSTGFDLKLSINLPEVEISAAKLSLCEKRQGKTKNCASGLQASVNNVKIKTHSKPVVVTATLRIKTSGKVARVTVRSVTTNLNDKISPKLNISIGSVVVPRIAIVIDGQETELETTGLKNEILNRKAYLSKQLLSFAGDFVAEDLAEMLNVYLVNKGVPTSYQVYRKGEKTFNEFKYVERDNTYVYLPMELGTVAANPMDVILKEISEIIRSARADISLKEMSTPNNKDIQLAGMLDFVLNGSRIQVRDTLGNSFRTLPKLNLAQYRNSDINLAISEPLINGALELANSTKLFQEIFNKVSPVKGFSIKNVKLHFERDALVAIVNAQVDLKKIESKGVGAWFKKKIAAWLERNNNNAVIYFPIEIAVKPVFKMTKGGGVEVALDVGSPFGQKTMHNTFGYPSNVPAMTDTVREGVMDELRESLEEYVNQTYKVNISDYLNQSGVVFAPRSISIDQNAYLLINMDIKDIKFSVR